MGIILDIIINLDIESVTVIDNNMCDCIIMYINNIKSVYNERLTTFQCDVPVCKSKKYLIDNFGEDILKITKFK